MSKYLKYNKFKFDIFNEETYILMTNKPLLISAVIFMS